MTITFAPDAGLRMEGSRTEIETFTIVAMSGCLGILNGQPGDGERLLVLEVLEQLLRVREATREMPGE